MLKKNHISIFNCYSRITKGHGLVFSGGGGHGLLILKVPGSSNFKNRENKEKDPCTYKMPDIQE